MQLRNICGFCKKNSLRTKHNFWNYSIVQCQSCGFIFRDQILSFKEGETLYDKDYYLNLQKEYFLNCLTPNPRDKSRINDFKSRIDLLKNFSTSDNLKLLDVGAGTGAFGYVAQKRGWQTLSVEISPFAAKIAMEKFKVKVYRGEVTDKNFKQKNFDIVTLWESIANIEDTPKLLKAIRRVLKRNGEVAILTTVVDSWLYDIANIINKLSMGKIKYFIKEGYPIHHANHFTRSNLARLLKEQNFEIVYQSNREIPYKYTKLPKIFLPLLLVFGQIAKIFGRTIQVLLIAKKA